MNKTISFAVVHFTVAFTVGYAMTGSVMVGGAIALVEPMVNTVAYHIHELIWKRREKNQVATQNTVAA
ncbi:MAG: DUF2061 domain-containing protein [Gammaproteobacteria bacterium]|nr:DUF2061 domain-containing protein [Gammaproteobacteria bacterium]